MSARGRFIVFEGIDGCGKSTQARRVAERLGAVLTFEPGDTPFGAALRGLVLDPSLPASPRTELLVMSADRAEHVGSLIEPTLAQGRDVVSDRYSASTLAYQGYGRGLDLEMIRGVTEAATGGLEADLVILLDCPVELAATRRAQRPDRFEHDELLERVRAGFLELASAPNWRVVDASGSLEQVSADVDGIVESELR